MDFINAVNINNINLRNKKLVLILNISFSLRILIILKMFLIY